MTTTLARLGPICLLAFALAACGGRVALDESFDPDADDTAASESAPDGDELDADVDEVIIVEDAPVPDDAWWEDIAFEDASVDDTAVFSDTGFLVDSGFVVDTGLKDSSVVDTGLKDSSVVDTGLKDSAVVDTGLKDSSVVDTGLKDTSVSDTGAAFDTTPFDVGPDVGGSVAATCAKIAKATCTSAFASCCKATGFTYDAVACDDVSRQWCDDSADGIYTGRTTYNPAYADACAAGWSALTTACQPHIFDWVKNQVACSQLFNGTTPPGGVCTRASDCRAGANETAWCDESAKRCRAASVVGLGGSCNYFGATIRWCDRGLTCDTTVGRCITATPIGGVCFGADDTSCGLGNTCKSGKCAAGAPPGATCTRDLECGSWDCSFGKCTDIRVTIASKPLCSGI